MKSTHSQTHELAIEVRDLRKSYGEVEAVRGVSFEVARGEVFCLLGPNGAGKTTTVEILEGYRVRSGGDVRVLGLDPAAGERELRERVGIVLQECGVQQRPDRRRAGRDVRALPRAAPAGRRGDRAGRARARSATSARKNLSGGQRRRLDLALALVGDPELIFLDEPTTGFDPAARRHAWSTIRSLCELGKTVFLTTHFMDEAQALADRVAVMRARRDHRHRAGRTSSADATCARPRSASRCRPAGRSATSPTCPRSSARWTATA